MLKKNIKIRYTTLSDYLIDDTQSSVREVSDLAKLQKLIKNSGAIIIWNIKEVKNILND